MESERPKSEFDWGNVVLPGIIICVLVLAFAASMAIDPGEPLSVTAKRISVSKVFCYTLEIQKVESRDRQGVLKFSISCDRIALTAFDNLGNGRGPFTWVREMTRTYGLYEYRLARFARWPETASMNSSFECSRVIWRGLRWGFFGERIFTTYENCTIST